MTFGRVITSAAAALSLLGTPVVAQAAAANLEQARNGSSVEGEELRGGFIIPLIAVVAILLGILAATGGNNDLPHSP